MHPADLCFKLPENVSLEEGAMCEPLSVGVHACRRANIGPETNVLVMGAGPIGLVTMLAARAFGAPRIVIVDVDDYRLSVAKDLAAAGVRGTVISLWPIPTRQTLPPGLVALSAVDMVLLKPAQSKVTSTPVPMALWISTASSETSCTFQILRH